MEPGFISALPWSTLTPSGLLALVVVLILLGWLVPKFVYSEKAKEADRWREAHERSERVRHRALLQVEVLVRAVDKLAGQKDLGAALIESVKTSHEEDQR